MSNIEIVRDGDSGFDLEEESRIIHLHDIIDDASVQNVIQQIQNINFQDDAIERQFLFKYNVKPERKPITLEINSYGGIVYDGLALISTIENSTTPVITKVSGYAMSMGFMIFLAGTERHISRHASLMYHQISSVVSGKLRDQEERILISQDLQLRLEDYVIERTKLKRKDLKKIYNIKQDYYINADQALELGIATKII